MYIQVTRSIFIDQFMSVRPENFSYAALNALFDYFDEQDDPAMELDIIAICCEFSEYASIEEYNESYGTEHESMDELEQETTLIRINEESFVAQDC